MDVKVGVIPAPGFFANVITDTGSLEEKILFPKARLCKCSQGEC